MSTRNSLQSPAYLSRATSSTSLVTPTLSVLADPPIPLVDGAAHEYLLIEMVHALRHSSEVSAERMRRAEAEMLAAGLLPAPPPPEKEPKHPGPSAADDKTKRETRSSLGSAGLRTVSGVDWDASSRGMEAGDASEEDLRLRLEAIGVHVGGNIAERLCRDRPRFSDTLDAVKFVCKDVWATCWDKQVDNLRTNHRGVYVLQDNQFKPIARISSYEGQADALRRAKIYIAMPVGIIKGALARMGYQASVVPEIQRLPACTFQIKLPKA